MDLDALAQDLLNAGPEGIRDLDQLESAKDPEFEDGI